jgi:hypothetical protein
LQKARRGALRFALPMGYVHTPSGGTGDDPDAHVQSVGPLILRKVEDLGTLHALLRSLVPHDIRRGVRQREGPATGTLEWRQRHRRTRQHVWKPPI